MLDLRVQDVRQELTTDEGGDNITIQWLKARVMNVNHSLNQQLQSFNYISRSVKGISNTTVIFVFMECTF